MEMQAVLNMYEARGFNITRVEGDREFACITNDILPIQRNAADADDHVHEVERSIRTVKERTRCAVQRLPFKRIPKAMMRAAIEGAHKALNQFPAHNGVSEFLSPLTIMTGRPNPAYNNMRIEFGAYAQVFEDKNPTNTAKARTTGAIALTPTGNAQGGFYLLSMITGRRLARQQWDELPMPGGVIASVERMAEDEGQPLIGHGAPLFEWSPGVAIEDEDPTPVLQAEHEDGNEPFFRDEYAQDFKEDPDDDNDNNTEADHELDETNEEFLEFDDVQIEPDNEIEQDGEEFITEGPDEQPASHLDEEEIRSESSSEVDELAESTDIPETTSRSRYGLRPNRTRNYSNPFDHVMDEPASGQSYDAQLLQHEPEDKPSLREAVHDMNVTGSTIKVFEYVTGFIMTQMTAKAGIKKHGQVAVDALFQEFLQLHDKTVFARKHRSELTKAERQAALRAISVIKEKRYRKIKGRTVAGGKPQRNLYTKDETSSPTISCDALMMSVLIDAWEHREVATADVT
jgi:hypothetical protein